MNEYCGFCCTFAMLVIIFVVLYMMMAYAMVATLTTVSVNCYGSELCVSAVVAVKKIFALTLMGIALAFTLSLTALIIETYASRK